VFQDIARLLRAIFWLFKYEVLCVSASLREKGSFVFLTTKTKDGIALRRPDDGVNSGAEKGLK